MWLDRFRLSHAQETAVQISAALQPRSTRFRLDIPVTFTEDEKTLEGRCLNVSDTGILATFNELPELWTAGLLVMEAGEHYLSINARVARIHGSDVGFAFSFHSDNDRAAIAILIASVSEYPLQ